MEIFVIILLITSFIFGVYLIINFNSPNDWLKKGIKHIENKEYQKANEIFTKLIGKHKEAEEKLSESYFKEALDENQEQAYSLFQKAIEIKPDCEYSKKSGEELAKIHYRKATNLKNRGDKQKAIEEFKKVIEFTKNQTSTTKDNAQLNLAEYKFEKSIELERKNDYTNAINEYKKVFNFTSQITDNQVQTKSENLINDTNCRIAISQLKSGKMPEQNIIDKLQTKKSKYKDDLFFRLSLANAKKNNIDKADEYIELIETENEELKKLRNYCNEKYKKQISQEIKRINNEVFSNDYVILQNLFDSLNYTKKIVAKALPSETQSIADIYLYTYSKLLNIHFNNNDYEGAINHIVKIDKFFNRPELLKNLGLSCLRIADEGKINSTNFQLICSIWLTAVYSDKVFLHSLDEVYWDDEYTFTLANSLGSHYNYDIDIENVNFESPDDNNICIGTTQKELVQIFESYLNNISDENLLKKVYKFYNSEKSTLEDAIKHIRKQIVFAPPYFAKKYKINEIIISELTESFENNPNEDIINTGLQYVTTEKPKIYEYYITSQNFVEKTIESIKQRDLEKLKSQNNPTHRELLNKFPKLKEKFENELIRSFEELTQKYSREESIISLFDQAINVSPTKAQLKYQAANFIVRLSVNKTNDNEMSHEKSLAYLVKAYKYNSDNQQIAENLAIIVKINCMEMFNDDISDNAKKKLKEIVRIKNTLLTNELRSALGEIFYVVLNGLETRYSSNIAKLIKIELGLLKADPFWDINSPEFSNERELAEKLKLIKNLIA